MNKAADWIARVIKTMAGILLVIVALAMLAVILGRYVGFVTAWADEVARIAFIWSASLGAASGTYRGLNFAVPLIAAKREGRTKQILDSGIALTMVALSMLMMWATTRSLPVAALARLPALGVSGAWFHSAIMAFAVLTSGFMLIKSIAVWRSPS